MLYFVGETIDKAQSHYQAGTGKLVQLMRGIYADANDDIDAAVLAHAVRIARYLYPNTFLSAASAVSLGPSSDGRLFLSGRRIQRTRIRGLEIIQNKAPLHPSLSRAMVGDDMGSFRLTYPPFANAFWKPFGCAENMPRQLTRLCGLRLPPALSKNTATRKRPVMRSGRWHGKTSGTEKEKARNVFC